MKALVTTFSFLLSALIYCPSARSQNIADTVELTGNITLLQQQYAATFLKNPALYNGPEYINYSLRYRIRTGHQFFIWPDKQLSSVQYNGQYFSNIFLFYDIVLDQLVLPFPDSPFMLRLLKENVSSFTINQHQFVKILADSTKGSPVATGYYEVLNTGTVQALAKRTKRLQEQIRQTKLQADFPENSQLFLKKNGVYYSVSSKKNMLRLFTDHTREVQKYIQDKKIKFKKNQLESILLELTLYYNTLIAA